MKNIQVTLINEDGKTFEKTLLGAEGAVVVIEYYLSFDHFVSAEIRVDGELFADDVTNVEEAKEILADCYSAKMTCEEFVNSVTGGNHSIRNAKLPEILKQPVRYVEVIGNMYNVSTLAGDWLRVRGNKKGEWRVTR